MVHMELTWRSVVLQMDTKVSVLLPENRHRTEDLHGKEYPVLYIFHGFKEDNSAWLNLSNIFLLARDLDLVVVMPTTYYANYVDNAYGLDYYTYLTEELPVKLRNYFPVSNKREDTFIMGESMGGYGTLRCALSRPWQYAKAVCLSSAPFDYADRIRKENFLNGEGMFSPSNKDSVGRSYKTYIGIYGAPEDFDSSDNNLYTLVERLKHSSSPKPDMAFYCGTEDFVYKRTKAFSEYLRTSCPDMKVISEFWHGKHNFFFWNQAIPKALAFFGFKIQQNSII